MLVRVSVLNEVDVVMKLENNYMRGSLLDEWQRDGTKVGYA